MTLPITFQEAQQAVAEKHGCGSFVTLCTLAGGKKKVDKLYAEAAELMAESWANYYVSEDREKIKNSCVYQAEGYDCFDEMMLEELPLPFPEER